MPTQASMYDDCCVSTMQNHFPNGVERSVLVNKLIEEHGLSENNARVKVCRAIKRGSLFVQGNVVQVRREQIEDLAISH